MGDPAAILVAVRAIVARSLGVAEDELAPTTDLYADLGADSLAVMELLGTLEDELGLMLPESTAFALELRTVGDVAAAFQSRVA